MQQDKTEMQTTEQLSEIRGVSVGTGKAHLRDVEQFIIGKYLGLPYRHRGRSLEGLDCWGFLKLVYADLGVRLFDIEDLEYSKIWGAQGKDYFKEHYFHDWVSVKTPEMLDGVLFVNSRKIANHAGIILSNGRFIHCARPGVIISRINDPSWQTKIEGFYRLKDRIC
ncbi:C40 family peptidase [Candidatus Velamenicoccus archaeovorus]|nr:NlpC/P60 family protein [Candidatus Velamenicoccus archaeovorus]